MRVMRTAPGFQHQCRRPVRARTGWGSLLCWLVAQQLLGASVVAAALLVHHHWVSCPCGGRSLKVRPGGCTDCTV